MTLSVGSFKVLLCSGEDFDFLVVALNTGVQVELKLPSLGGGGSGKGTGIATGVQSWLENTTRLSKRTFFYLLRILARPDKTSTQREPPPQTASRLMRWVPR